LKVYQDKSILHLIDADGKECKTEVLRQERLKQSVFAGLLQSGKKRYGRCWRGRITAAPSP
jgi:hypothetical protein